jgi:chromosome segregation ATPase
MDWVDLATGGSVLVTTLLTLAFIVSRIPSIIDSAKQYRKQEIDAESASEKLLMEQAIDTMTITQLSLAEVSGAFKTTIERVTELENSEMESESRLCELEREMEQMKQDHQSEIAKLKSIIAQKEVELEEVRAQLAEKDAMLEAERNAAKKREAELQDQIKKLKAQLEEQSKENDT